MSKKHKGTVIGLRSVQTLGALAVPVPLEQVPEDVEVKNEIRSSKSKIFRTDDWKSVEKCVKDIIRHEFIPSQEGIIYELQLNVKNILRSKTGTFLCDCYKEWLTKEMEVFAGKLKSLDGTKLLFTLEEMWTTFYSETLPMIEAILHQLKPNGRLSVRSIALVTFRDIVALSTEKIEERILEIKEHLSLPLRQMIMVLYSVNDSHPPGKNKLRLESIVANTYSPFMGYYGLYKKGELVVTSNEPAIQYKRRPSAIDTSSRRISRPFRMHSQQVDSLRQMFKKALRHKPVHE